MAMGNQLGLVVAGFGPTIAGLLIADGINGWIPVAVFGAVVSALAAVAVLSARETAFTPVKQLGEPYLRATGQWPADEEKIISQIAAQKSSTKVTESLP